MQQQKRAFISFPLATKNLHFNPNSTDKKKVKNFDDSDNRIWVLTVNTRPLELSNISFITCFAVECVLLAAFSSSPRVVSVALFKGQLGLTNCVIVTFPSQVRSLKLFHLIKQPLELSLSRSSTLVDFIWFHNKNKKKEAVRSRRMPTHFHNRPIGKAVTHHRPLFWLFPTFCSGYRCNRLWRDRYVTI